MMKRWMAPKYPYEPNEPNEKKAELEVLDLGKFAQVCFDCGQTAQWDKKMLLSKNGNIHILETDIWPSLVCHKQLLTVVHVIQFLLRFRVLQKAKWATLVLQILNEKTEMNWCQDDKGHLVLYQSSLSSQSWGTWTNKRIDEKQRNNDMTAQI